MHEGSEPKDEDRCRSSILSLGNSRSSAAAEGTPFVVNPLNEGLLFDASFLSAYTLRKILIPHSTTTMADTSVATANTLSKEATSY